MIAGSDAGRVLRSTDGGETFEEIASVDEEIVTLVASPGFADDGRLLASTPERVFRVSDGGETWEPVEGSPRSILSLTISSGFAEDGIAFAGTKSGLFRSQDGGATWKRVTGTPLGPNPYVEAAVTSPDFADDGTVLVSARGLGLFRSTDGGATFQPVGDDLRARNVLLASFYHPTAEPSPPTAPSSARPRAPCTAPPMPARPGSRSRSRWPSTGWIPRTRRTSC